MTKQVDGPNRSTTSHSRLGVVFVLWGGYIGGAESFTCDMAIAMRRLGANPAVVFVLDGEPLSQRLSEAEIPCASLSLSRGRDVLTCPRRFSTVVSQMNGDVAILIESGYIAAALRIGGYRRPIICVEHGSILLSGQPLRKRILRAIDRASGAFACSSVVAVSGFIAQRVGGTRARRLSIISNGVDLTRFSPGTAPDDGRDDLITIGCAARLIEGKGVDDLLRAVASPRLDGIRLRIAGDGPKRTYLESLASALGVTARVEFVGRVTDMPKFWRASDIVVIPSNEFVESFGMAAVEAMACAKPVVASTSGALPDLVTHGHNGLIFESGDIAALAAALAEYVDSAALRDKHGQNGRRTCAEQFDLDKTADKYLRLSADLIAAQRRR